MPRYVAAFFVSLVMSVPAGAADYDIDIEGQHAFVQFRVKHLGYSWLYGSFNDFSGSFQFDESAPGSATVSVTIKTASVDSNHAERDKHLRGDDFLDVKKYPEASFVSTSSMLDTDGTGTVSGNLTLHGVTRPVTLEVEGIGAGADPWGGYRRGFLARTRFKMADFGMTYDLGPASEYVEMILSIEGVRR
ncbi:MAG: YceI family protein [Gammaproteobacteria bacterium]|nr:YceI family protein [Gammaproteobacteria bacterium]